MEFSGLVSGDKRLPTWAERDRLEKMRAAGVEDVYAEVESADEALWQSLLIATHWYVIGSNAAERPWNLWYAEFRWAHGLPESDYGSRREVYKSVVADGHFPATDGYRTMSPGQRLSAVEHLLDVVGGDPDDFARAINEKAVFLRIGVRLEGRRFVRVTSEHMHDQVTRPALLLLSDPRFETVDRLYRKAFDRALANDHSGAVTAATSSVEEMLRIGLGESGGRLQPLLQKGRQQEWVIPAVEQLAVKLDALRSESDAHTAGTDETHVAMLALHVAGAILVHLGAAAPAVAS